MSVRKMGRAKRAWLLAVITDTVCAHCEATPAERFGWAPGWQSSSCIGCWRKEDERERVHCAALRAGR